MLPFEHSAILSTFIKLPFVLSILEWPLKTGSTVHEIPSKKCKQLNLDGESANSLCEMKKNEYFLCNFLSFFRKLFIICHYYIIVPVYT